MLKLVYLNHFIIHVRKHCFEVCHSLMKLKLSSLLLYCTHFRGDILRNFWITSLLIMQGVITPNSL